LRLGRGGVAEANIHLHGDLSGSELRDEAEPDAVVHGVLSDGLRHDRPVEERDTVVDRGNLADSAKDACESRCIRGSAPKQIEVLGGSMRAS
jgi:hypothetical protein